MGKTTKNHVSTYIDDGLLTSLDRLASSLGKSRAATVYWVLSEFEDGMNRISECMEFVTSETDEPMAEFLNIISHATYQIKEGSFSLVGSPESRHDSDD